MRGERRDVVAGARELLFLDEPTTGLDPQSRRQLWEVVRAYQAGGGTVVLTTHYMDEAQQLCNRIAIVDHGKVIALGTPAELIRSLGAEHFVEVEAAGLGDGSALTALRELAGVRAVEVDGDRAELTVTTPHAVVPRLLALLAARGSDLRGLATRQATLEDVFVHLTGRHLREDHKP